MLTLQLDGGSELALPKAVQRHPIRGDFEHVDLLLVRLGEKVTVEVPITLVGAVVRDGLVDQQLMTLSIEAEATHLPSGVEVDISRLAVGGNVSAGQVPLPPGSSLVTDADYVVVAILASPTAEQVEAEIAGTEVGGAGAEPATTGEPAASTS